MVSVRWVHSFCVCELAEAVKFITVSAFSPSKGAVTFFFLCKAENEHSAGLPFRMNAHNTQVSHDGGRSPVTASHSLP